jgi:PAS domain S-box-containing protein
MSDNRQVQQEATDLFEAVFRDSPQAMVITRLQDGLYLDANEAFLELTGQTIDQVLGTTSVDLHWTDPDARAQLAEDLRAHGNATAVASFRVRGGALRECWFSCQTISFRGEPCVLTTIRDETELHRMQEELKEREERLRMLVDGMPGVIWTTDSDLRLTLLQGAGLRRMPFASEEFVGKRLPELLGPDSDAYRDEMEAPLVGRPSFFEATIGDHVLSVFSQPLRQVDGTMGTMGAAIDVTHNRRAEESLRRTADRLRSVNDLSLTIASARNPDEVARQACERIRSLLPCTRAAVSVFDPETQTGRVAAVHSDTPTEIRPGYTFPAATMGPLSTFRYEGLSFEDLAQMEDPAEPFATLIREGVRTYMVTPLVVEADVIGFMAIGSPEPGGFDDESVEVAREVASLLAVAFHQSRLYERAESYSHELEVRLEQLRLTDAERRRLLAQVVRTQEEERRRISNDIHDDSVQKMAAVGLRLDAIRHFVSDAEILTQIDQLSEVVSLSIGRLRRLMFELWPPDLERYGLAAAIRADLLAQRDDFAIEFSLTDDMTEKIPLEERIIAYRIVQEALSNVRKHSGARKVEVTLATLYGGVQVTVADDGHGLPTEIRESPPGHLGLTTMRERAELVGGWLKLSNRDPRGTLVEFFIPAVETTTDTQADARDA